MKNFILLFLLLTIWFYDFQNIVKSSDAGSESWTVISKDSKECAKCPAGIKYRLVIQNSQSTIERTVEVASMMRLLHDVIIIDSKALLFGELTHSGNVVLIYDLEKNHISDELYGYQFNLSSDGKHLVYLRFYPRFTPRELVSDVVLLYALDGDSKTNRLSSVVSMPNQENGGIPVYPPSNVELSVLTPQLDDDGKVLVLQPMIWGESNVIFIAQHVTNEIVIVKIDLSKGIAGFCGSASRLEETLGQKIVSSSMQLRREFLESNKEIQTEWTYFGPGCNKKNTKMGDR